MGGTPPLYDTLVQVLSHHQNWLELRHLKTLAWMIVGLMPSGKIGLTAWAPYVHSRAVYAQSRVRRVARWLDNHRIDVHALYSPLMPQALTEWGSTRLDRALDPATLWTTDGLVRVSLVYRGRAIPLVWTVLEHPSSRVADDVYQDVWEKGAALLPVRCHVVFPADRGFADTHLLDHLARLGWHWRLRIKGSVGIDRGGKRPCKVTRIALAVGQALFWHHVTMTKNGYGPVPLARGRPQGRQESWCVVSDESTESKTCAESGLRFDIEENVLDDTSHGFQLDSSLSRSANAVERLCCVWAITTLDLVAQGPAVVTAGQRRWVDAHWFRGQSYLNSGWGWIKLALSRGHNRITSVHLPADAEPAPAMASKSQHQTQAQLFFTLEFQDAVA